MLVFTYIIFHTYVVAPLFSVGSVIIPPDMWELLKIGMGGYVFGRTVEKITPDIAAAIGNRKDANVDAQVNQPSATKTVTTVTTSPKPF